MYRPARKLQRQRARAAAAALAPAVRPADAGRDLIMPLLDIRDLSKRFGARHGRETPWVIQGLSFSVNDGEFLTVVGPSGAGKTTLLNMIAQIDSANSGEV